MIKNTIGSPKQWSCDLAVSQADQYVQCLPLYVQGQRAIKYSKSSI